jgi:hypothetical protein
LMSSYPLTTSPLRGAPLLRGWRTNWLPEGRALGGWSCRCPQVRSQPPRDGAQQRGSLCRRLSLDSSQQASWSNLAAPTWLSSWNSGRLVPPLSAGWQLQRWWNRISSKSHVRGLKVVSFYGTVNQNQPLVRIPLLNINNLILHRKKLLYQTLQLDFSVGEHVKFSSQSSSNMSFWLNNDQEA